jgi:hypothetical protein
MKEVWVVLYASGYTSEATTDLFLNYEDAYNYYIEQVKMIYSDGDDYKVEDIIRAIENKEVIETEGVSLYGYDLTFDCIEVYERIDLYKQEIL